MENVQVIEKQKPKSFWGRAKDALFVGAMGASAMGVTLVHADDGLDFSGTTTQVSGAKTAIVSVISTLLVITGIVLAWSYFRRSAK